MAWRGGQGQGAGSPFFFFFFEGEFPLAKRAYLIALRSPEAVQRHEIITSISRGGRICH